MHRTDRTYPASLPRRPRGETRAQPVRLESATLAALNYRNLDEVPEFTGKNTTTEFLAKTIFDRITDAVRAGSLGPGAFGLDTVKVTLKESHVAWGAYEGRLT